VPKASAADLVARARRELRRDAPSTWAEVQEMLVGALRRAAIDGQKEIEAEATERLTALREKQALWFNQKRCARLAALNVYNLSEADRVAAPCRAVFSNPDDRRFYEVREWRTQ
jgi:hypothetical protein